ncbi:MAG: adenylate/guanylate cyclase domain-containing protein, partial [Saprospiraceae bacterium]|nr:adenylate/guanylate cyclase domain-containing protein [Saprospiraceae bacterium]
YETALENDAKQEVANSLNSLGNTYQQIGSYEAAIENYRRAIDIAEEVGLNNHLKTAYEGLAIAHAALGEYEEAYDSQQEFNKYKDITYNEDYDRAMGELRFQFDVEQKEAEIELLNKENDLKEAQIQRSAIQRNFLIAIAIFLLVTAGGITYSYLYARKSNKIITEERNRSDKILLNILPKETADELKDKGYVEAKKFEQTTVLFTDFREFTRSAEKVSPEDLVKSIDYYFKHFDEIINKHDLEKIKTIGDAYMCAGGLPVPNDTNARDAVRAALEIQSFIEKVKVERPEGVLLFDVRIGINTGPVVAGVVGINKFQYDIWGATVNIASRMESSSEPGKINISENTHHLIKDEFDCLYRGEISVKHSGKMKMYFVEKEAEKMEPVEV